MLGIAESEHHRLTNREIIFEEFQRIIRIWSLSTNVTNGWTGNFLMAIPRESSASVVRSLYTVSQQESPADAVKPARRKSMQKLSQFDVFRFISPNSISPNFKV